MVGKIRLRQKGSAGGHNGIKSLISHLGTQTFDRIKVGIGRPKGRQTVIDHVLSGFDKEDRPLILQGIDASVDALTHYIDQGDFMASMNRFNKKGE